MGTMIDKAFSADAFQKNGHELIDILAEELKACEQAETPNTLHWESPEKQLAFWKQDFEEHKETNLPELAQKILSRSTHFHSTGYMGHQVAVPAPVTALTAALTSYMSNCTTVYEIGMVGNAMEKVVIGHMAQKYGYDSRATGIVTSGGSLGNLTALVTARTSSGVEEKDYHRLAVMVSEEAHYSVERAAKIMGIPAENVIKIPSDRSFRVRTDLLEESYQKASNAGKLVFCVVGCACTTAVGAYDDLEAIADFAERHSLWFHVDGAHGGAVIFSEKYRHLLRGIERSDSLIVDFHKMLLAPALSTAVIYNAGRKKVSEFSPKAAYLWQNQLTEEWYNSGKHTIECTKPMTIVGAYALMRLYGDALYEEHVDLGKNFAQMIRAHADMELAVEPESNIVCFRVLDENGDSDKLNKAIAEALLKDGTYYIVNTTVRGKFYLRVSLMNPMTGEKELEGLLDKVLEIAGSQKKSLPKAEGF